MLTHRASFYTEKHLHTASSYTEKLLQTEAFTHSKLLHTASFCSEKLYTEKLLHRECKSKLLHTAFFFTEKLHIKPLHKEKLLHREDFTQSKLFHSASICTEKLLHREAFTQSKLLHTASKHSKLLHREAFAQRSPFTEKLLHKASSYTEKLLHREAFSFYTEKLLHKASFYTEKLLHTASFYKEELLHKASFCTEKLLHTASFYTEKLLHKASFCTENFFHSKLLHREAANYTGCTKIKHICCQSTIRNLHAAITFYNLRFSAARNNSIPHAPAAARNLDAAIPLRSAETELPSAIELQHKTVERIALMHQSNAQSVSTHAKHNSTAATKKRKSRLQHSVPLRAHFEQDSTAKRRRPRPSRARAYFSPQQNLRAPGKTQCFVQILTFKSHP